jgi:predicted lipoprotein with Yx(FWY)xxD motif
MRLVRILALAFAVVLAACGSSGSKSTSTNTTVASSATTAAAASSAVINSGQTSLGSVLVNGQGRTLYHFTKDTGTTIACTGACATTWPPVTVPAGQQPQAGSSVTAKLTVVNRPDGTQQVAANGQPLYMFSGDTKAGDTNGQGFGGFWFALGINGSSIAGAGSSATTKATTATTAASSGGVPGY